MATFVAKDYVITINAGTVSGSCAAVTLTANADDVETTAFGDDWRTRIGGLKSGSVSFSFHQDFGSGGIDSVFWPLLGTVGTVTIKPGTAAVGATNPLYSAEFLVTTWSPFAGAVGDLATVDVEFPISGEITRGTTA
jgi:hypothetical protein